MIPILYPAKETTFSSNGLGGLPDAVSCMVTEERNGEYFLEMQYPITGLHYDELRCDRIICAPAHPGGDPQPFRIRSISRPIDGIVTIDAPHVSYALSHYVVIPFRITTRLPGDFLHILERQTIPEWHPFHFRSFRSALQVERDMGVHKPVSARMALGGMEGSFLDVFGGEIEWSGFDVNIYNSRGQDRGVRIEYGKNMTAITATQDTDSLMTGALAYAMQEDNCFFGFPAYTPTPQAERFAFERIALVDCTNQKPFPSQDELSDAAYNYIAAHACEKIAESVEVKFVPLLEAAGEGDRAALEEIRLCDTVTVVHPGLRMDAKLKVVKTVYDVLRGRFESLTLGKSRRGISDAVSGLSEAAENTPRPADTVVEQGRNGIWAFRKYASGLAECWGTANAKIDISSSSGVAGLVFSSASVSAAFPAGLFGAPPVCTFSYDSSHAAWAYTAKAATASATQGVRFYRAGAAVTGADVKVHFRAIGT